MRASKFRSAHEALTANCPASARVFSIGCGALSLKGVQTLSLPQSSRRSHGIQREKIMTKTGMIFGSLAIVALVGAVAVAVENGGFSTLLSSITTRPSADRSETRTSSAAPSQPPEVKPGAIEPAPAPSAQLPAPTPPARVSNDSRSSAKTAPSLDNTGGIPSAQAGSRVTAADVLVPDAENGARRTALTAEEKEAVARGLKELGITTANATPSSQSEQAATAELNRKALADTLAAEARSKQLQAQNQQ